MKKHLMIAVIIILLLPAFSGCKTYSEVLKGEEAIKAVYLVPGNGWQIPEEELAGFPGVAVAGSLERLKDYMGTKAAIWIDINAVNMVDIEWLHQEPQKYYPIVLVGCSDALYAFRETLHMDIAGPYVDWSKADVTGGFSVWMLENEAENSSRAVMKGYSSPPDIEQILNITNSLLGRRLE